MNDYGGGGIVPLPTYQIIVKQRGREVAVKRRVAVSALAAIEMVEGQLDTIDLTLDDKIVKWSGLEFEARRV